MQSYGKIWNLGHREVKEILADPVLVEEKLDGSQLSFGVYLTPNGSELIIRSKGCIINQIAPEGMFNLAVKIIQEMAHTLTLGYTYRGEYLVKPKHNTLVYNRTPIKNIMIFDIDKADQDYMTYEEKKAEASRIGLELVPIVFFGKINDAQQFREMLQKESILGGQKIEGVVIKNYLRYDNMKKTLMAKFVSEEFKEIHQKTWDAENPSQTGIIDLISETLRTPARWNKSIQKLRDEGKIEDSPKDIGNIIKLVREDLDVEATDYIKEELFKHFKGDIMRNALRGLPEWYKEQLVKKQFENTEVSNGESTT